jgi:hypothetical protein
MGSVSHEQVPAAPAPAAASSPMGAYGPKVSITRFDTAPRELEWQLPLDGELYRLIPGPDRPDYSLLVLERPLHFYPAPGFDVRRVEADQRVEDRKGRPMVRVHALLVCSRFVGQQLQPGMRDLAVNIAYVLDNSLARDEVVDFSKIEVAAAGYLSEGHVGRPAGGPDEAVDPTQGRAGAAAQDVVAHAAQVLRDGVSAHRGRPVARLAATLVVGPDHRLVGLSGNADGDAPAPTPETFEHVNAILAGLAELDEGPSAPASESAGRAGETLGVRRFTVRVEGDAVAVEESTGPVA